MAGFKRNLREFFETFALVWAARLADRKPGK